MNVNYLLFFKYNLFISLTLFLSFLWHYNDYTVLSFILIVLGAFSSAIILYIVFYILLFIFSFTKQFIMYLSATLFILTNIALVVDWFIYKLFHFHLNAMVLNILTSPDAMDSVQVGIFPILLFISIIILFIFFEIYLLRKIQKENLLNKRKYNAKINTLITLPFFFIILSEKISFGLATLVSKSELILPFKVIPLYQPLTFNRLAAKHFGFNAEKQAQLSIETNSDLHYPMSPLTLAPNITPFDIFIIVSDSVKYSIVNKEVTPNIAEFAQDALVFNHHYSGGNSTRFGIFSLIYGLNASYWFSFLNAHQKPVLFDVLKKQSYDISIISSTNTNWPEFRKTCYVDIQKSIEDSFEGEPWQKDKKSTACFLGQLSQVSKKKRFTFIFLDAPHGYSYPENANIYDAPNGELNYLAITKKSKELQTVIKRYKNAVHYNDMLFGKMIKELKRKNLYKNALILYTSDHGQEFFEQGNFGHNTAFSKPQIHVPLIIKLPKHLQGTLLIEQINTSMSSHQDIVPTILSLLGVQNNPSEYSNGFNVFDKNFHRDYIVSANWNNSAIVSNETISVFSNLPNKIFNNEVRDANSYKLYKHKKTKSKYILEVMQENKKFLR